jgi:uncharacterized protein YkwD
VVQSTGSGNNPIGALFPTETFTPTLTFTPTNTVTPSLTATITFTPTITLTPTPNAPFPYTIIEGDTLQSIAEKFNLGPNGVLLLLEFNPQIVERGGIYFVGETIVIPPPGTELSTPTPIPAGVREIEYTVLPGDTLAGIAAKFNSTVEDIIKINNIENENAIQAGQKIRVRVNLVTPTPTLPPTSTPVTPTVPGQPTQAPPTIPIGCAPTENAAFVSELQTLINNARTSNNLAALILNDKLTAAAKTHATDLLCTNSFSHFGSNGSTPESRVAAQGYIASLVLENLFAQANANPQAAFDWWKLDSTSLANLLNPNVTEFGIAYVTSSNSLLGGYFVVVFAKP